MVFAGLALMFAGMAAGALWISAVGVTAIVLLAAGTTIAALAAVR
jgi:hypothetical protein